MVFMRKEGGCGGFWRDHMVFMRKEGRSQSSLTEYKREDLVKIVSDTWPRTFLEYNVRPLVLYEFRL